MPTISHQSMREFVCNLYIAQNTPEDIAKVVSDYQVNTNLQGHDSHGCISIPRFRNDVKTGKVIPDARPETIKDHGATALINGNRSFGMYSATMVTDLAIAKARDLGISAVGSYNSNHLGALWGYMERVVNAGLIGIMYASAGPRGGSMAPYGGTRPALAGNPIGFGVPCADQPPMIADISTAVVAGGKVLLALHAGEKIPGHWVLNREGNPTTNPEDFITPECQILGTMLPFGGHKGYSIALLAEVLGAILTGYGAAYKDDYIEGNGPFVIAIDIDRFVDPAIFRTEVTEYIKNAKSVPTNEETEEILYPGELEARARTKREKEGIPFSESVWQSFVDVADELGIAVPDTV